METKSVVVQQYGGFTDEEVDSVAVHVRALLDELGLKGEHFDETPRRVGALLRAFTQDVPLGAVLKDGFEVGSLAGELVVQKAIPFKGLCAHHLVPFFGTAAIGYVPGVRVVGLSKLTRLVQAAGSRAPSTQEEITSDVVEALFGSSRLAPLGVIAVSRAVHGCMAVRGVNAPRTETTSVAQRGVVDRGLFFELVGEDW